ncbi:MAG: methyltransferase domain-containing protein [Sedimentisphaerales bacterium]|nr:methyltransferase domain-containing protein [Sedimentisphaerales bacterium]
MNKAHCPICELADVVSFLHRENMPVFQNMLFRRQSDATNAKRGSLALAVCSRCGFVFNAAFDQTKMDYNADYDNTQTCSPHFASYVDERAAHLLSERRLHHRRIVEVGCGKGYFLRKLVEDERAGNVGYGYDPSYVGPEVDLGGRLNFQKCLYTAETADIHADTVVCRHVIEHLPDPVALLQLMSRTLSGATEPLVALETPCVGWILRNRVVWDFYHEHCSYFAAGSLGIAAERAGLQPQSLRHVFGDQYLWLEATPASHAPVRPLGSGDEMVSLCRAFAAVEASYVQNWRTKLAELTRVGAVALWGAGAKGVTLANLVDPDRELVACVVDLNPRKQGCFLPGTGHPIVDYKAIPALQVKIAIPMNPNYVAENMRLVREAGLDLAMIDPADWRQIR